MTQLVDVVETCMMNTKPGDYKVIIIVIVVILYIIQNILSCAMYTGRMGPFGFFKV